MRTDLRVLMLLAACAACGSEELVLDGREFRLQTADGFQPLAGSTISLRFEDGQVGASAGCNSMSGSYQVRDAKLVVSGLATTEIGCEPAAHAQDEWLARFLMGSPTLSLNENELTARAEGATLTFLDREVADPDLPLVGTRWAIDTFIEDGAAANAPLTRDPSARFEADGRFGVDTTCNTIEGRYELRDGTLALSNVLSTDALCVGAPGFADAHLLRLFRKPTLAVKIEARRLTLGDDEFGVAAIAE